jgi:hypothetical protein
MQGLGRYGLSSVKPHEAPITDAPAHENVVAVPERGQGVEVVGMGEGVQGDHLVEGILADGVEDEDPPINPAPPVTSSVLFSLLTGPLTRHRLIISPVLS